MIISLIMQVEFEGKSYQCVTLVPDNWNHPVMRRNDELDVWRPYGGEDSHPDMDEWLIAHEVDTSPIYYKVILHTFGQVRAFAVLVADDIAVAATLTWGQA